MSSMIISDSFGRGEDCTGQHGCENCPARPQRRHSQQPTGAKAVGDQSVFARSSDPGFGTWDGGSPFLLRHTKIGNGKSKGRLRQLVETGAIPNSSPTS